MDLLPHIPGNLSETLGRCAIVGGSGFLGSNLAIALHGAGVDITTFSRHANPDLTKAGIPHICADICDSAALSRELQGFQTVFHTASSCNLWGSRKVMQTINVDGTANVLDACRNAGCSSLIYTSTACVTIGKKEFFRADESLPYPGSYLSYYPWSKMLAEKSVLEANSADLRTCSLRPHLIWGPDDPYLLPGIVKCVRHGIMRRLGSCRNQVSLSHIGNVVLGHILAAVSLAADGKAAGKAYFLCDSEPVDLWQWMDDFIAGMKLPPVRRRMGTSTAMFLSKCWELTSRIFPFIEPPFISPFVIRQITGNYSFSCKRAETDFGYKPCISSEAGLQELSQKGLPHLENI